MTTDNDDYQICLERHDEEYEEYCREQQEYYKDFLVKLRTNEVDNCCEYSYWMGLIEPSKWDKPICMPCRKKIIKEFARSHRTKYERAHLKKRIIKKKLD
jgi:hypothetical protein